MPKNQSENTNVITSNPANRAPCDTGDGKPCRRRRSLGNPERMERLSRPTARRLRSLWDERCELLAPHRRDNIKSALEEEYFMTPEQTEEYFRAVQATRAVARRREASVRTRREQERQADEMRQRQQWLIDFSAQVAYRLCDYVTRGQKELLVSNRLRSIADVVLERVAEILGEPKPSRACGGRLARFMVAISDRIAVWIESAAYRAAALAPPPPPPPPTERGEVRFEPEPLDTKPPAQDARRAA